MSSKSEKDRQKAIQDKCQTLLTEMLRDEDNKYCVDCDAKGPRWASWNLGIFLCIRCAGIHRNLGVHISKVKSVNLDTWTPEQVVSLQQMGNSRARAVYEANLPDSFRRPQTDTALEAFVRAKYEQKKYIAREWVPPTLPKVNWDKEIEEEEQARRRRKEGKSSSSNVNRIVTSSPGNHSISSEIPAPLPKPRSSASPKPSRTSTGRASSTAISTGNTSGTLDLLGLDTPINNTSSPNNKGDDIFSGFLSAPVADNKSNSNASTSFSDNSKLEASGKNSIKSKQTAEEESFFNQPATSSVEKKQFTKDSILALYSNMPTTNPIQSQPQAFANVPGSVYPISNFGVGLGGNFPMPNGIVNQSMQPGMSSAQNAMFPNMGGNTVPAPTGVMNSSNSIPGMVSNPFFNMTGPATAQNNVFPVQNQRHDISKDLLDFEGSSYPAVGIKLPQQMGRLNLGDTSTSSAGMFGGTPHTTQQPTPNVLGNPWMNSTQPNMNMISGMGQNTFPQNQASVGHTLATNLWQ